MEPGQCWFLFLNFSITVSLLGWITYTPSCDEQVEHISSRFFQMMKYFAEISSNVGESDLRLFRFTNPIKGTPPEELWTRTMK